MAKKKTEEKKTETSVEKTTTPKVQQKKEVENVEKFSISELLKKNTVKPIYAVGFLNYYGLSEEFKKEFETDEEVIKFSEEEFDEMYKKYIEREI